MIMKLTPLESWAMEKTGIKERDKEALVSWQLGKIRETVAYAKQNSAFYGRLLKGVLEEDLCSAKSLESIPFTLPQDIRNDPLGFLCVPQKKVARVVTLNTSGTSGEDKRLFFTEEDLDLTIDFFKCGMSCLTDETDRVLVLLPGNAYGSIGDLLKKALALSNIECIVHGVLKDPDEAAACITERGITCIVGIPMQVLKLSRVRGDVFRNNIKKILLSTDYVPDAVVYELSHKFGCKVFNHYGMTEMGYGGGVECEALNGYHMREADLYFEIIDPYTGKAAEKEQYGEVVFTTLTRQAMPLIRYKTGDIASFSSASCTCGTFLNTMKKVLGRMENRILLGENRFLYLRDLDEIILPFGEVLDYKAYLEDKGEFLLELTVKDSAGSAGLRDKVAQRVLKLLPKEPEYRLNVVAVRAENKPG